MYKNMKIQINEQQPLDEVIKTLESKGLKLTFKLTINPEWVTFNNSGYGFFNFNPTNFHKAITLDQLKAMG